MKEQKTTTVSELTVFGGLAKVLIPHTTESGVYRNLGSPSLLTTNYLKVKLGSCKIEKVYNEESDEIEHLIIDRSIPFYREVKGREYTDIQWRDSLWNVCIFRSLEIWKTLSKEKIERSLGGLTVEAKRSLSGKLGSGNNRYFKKDNLSNWVFIKFKENNYTNDFKPLSKLAIEHCKKRAVEARKNNN